MGVSGVARQAVETAQRNHERLKSPLQKGYVSQQQVDNAAAQLENARAQLTAALAPLLSPSPYHTDANARGSVITCCP